MGSSIPLLFFHPLSLASNGMMASLSLWEKLALFLIVLSAFS